MSARARVVISVAAALAWGQVQYISGYNAGADTMLCVMENGLLKTPVAKIEACGRLWAADPRLALVRAWRAITNDSAEIDRLNAEQVS